MIPFKADWAAIRKRKQEDLIGKGVVRSNRSRVPHQYRVVGDAVLYHTPGKIPKMQQP
jgi:hypothetical protein